jgi:hypothetical protein
MRRASLLVLLTWVVACGDRTVVADQTEATSGSSSDSDTGGGDSGSDDPDSGGSGGSATGGSETVEPLPTCFCVDLELVCGDQADMATYECALPSPCGLLDDKGDDAETTECVVQLLIAQQPARFQYEFSNDLDDGFETETWSGWFYILGPGEGLDNECYFYKLDLGGSPMSSAAHYLLAEPAFFEGCLGGTADEMRSCLLSGLDKGEPLAVCSPS